MEPVVPNQRLEPPATKGKGRGKTAPFELCEVCRLNHDQGRRHRYQASHRRALSALLSRFQSKLANLRHPNPLQPEHRLWCVFCGIDLRVDSPFACSKAITHLANPEHLKSLKDFLWKHGGGMDQLDTFRISEADFLKWEKSCKSLENEVLLSSEESLGQLVGPTKAIGTIKYAVQISESLHLLHPLYILLLVHLRACSGIRAFHTFILVLLLQKT